MTKPVVAHFIRGFLRPTETFIGNQLNTLQKYEPRIFCHHIIKEHTVRAIQPTVLMDSLSPIRKKVETFSYLLFRQLSPLSISTLEQSIKKVKPKLLHFHYLVEARFFLPLARRLKLPSVVSGYGWDVSSFPKSKFGYGRIYLQPIFNELNLFLAMSDDMKKDIVALGCPESKVIVHYYGTETQRFKFPERRYDKQNKIKILFCGRLAPKKAPQHILYALKKLEVLKSDLPQWELTFVGDGPLRYELELLVREYGWDKKVFFTGHIPHNDNHLLEQYKTADIYVQPSITANGEKEGIPGTLVEAMASGLPVISTYHAGIPSVIKNNNTGLLVEEGQIDELTQKINGLISDPFQRELLGKSASDYALDMLDLVKKTKELESIYDSLVK